MSCQIVFVQKEVIKWIKNSKKNCQSNNVMGLGHRLQSLKKILWVAEPKEKIPEGVLLLSILK